MSCFARKMPFSSGSGVFVFEIIPWTALMSGGFGSPTRASAVRRTSARGMCWRAGTLREGEGPPHEHIGRHHRIQHDLEMRGPAASDSGAVSYALARRL